MLSVAYRLRKLDQKLRRFVGLASDPQARRPVDLLLDERLSLMFERDCGYRVNDRRKLRA